MKPDKRIKAFPKEAIHAGNKGLLVDHPAVRQEVDRLLGEMTLAQKLHELHGRQPAPIDGLYHAGGDETLNIPPYKMVDGPRGARAGYATAFPVAIARGATFDVTLERRVGLAMGLEVLAKGGNVILAPTINLLRHPGWGRAQETYSEDPFHMGAMAVSFVSGAQNHVLASPKHFALNNQEMTRFEASANIDLRTLHEVYLPHFKRCVMEGAAASVMSAYNKVNGIYCGEHPLLLTDILRDLWGFVGFVESDWFLGTRSTGAAINAGMDIEMPAAYRYQPEQIQAALSTGEIDAATITGNVSRVLYQKVAYQLGRPTPVDEQVIECVDHIRLARETAEKSFVLLKNDGILPLVDAPDTRIAVIGDLADTVNLGDRGSSFVTSSTVTTPWQGLMQYVNSARLTLFRTDDDLSCLADFDVCILVVGLTYIEEGEFIPTQQQEAEAGELARGGDRSNLRLPEQQERLIKRVSELAGRTVVLLEGGSAIEVTNWVAGINALMMIWYPGREGGHAVARTLFGEVNPSGRLPVTFPAGMNQLPDWDITALDIPHDLFHGYRYLDRQGHRPSYAFGFGLSYTTFHLDGLKVERGGIESSATGNGFCLVVAVSNRGKVAGDTVVQVYVSCHDSRVERVPKELKGFGRVSLQPGETAEVEFEILDTDLMYYAAGNPDEGDRGWLLEPCGYEFKIGLSSDELPLATTWRFDGDNWHRGSTGP